MTLEQLSKGNEIKEKIERCNNAIKLLQYPDSIIRIFLSDHEQDCLPNDDILINSIADRIRTYIYELEEKFKNL